MRRTATALLLLAAAATARAEEVRLRHDGLTLDGALSGPIGEQVVLLVHGTLQHNRTELMRALQDGLSARGIPSLAVTLSLGEDNRRGALDCGVVHRHRQSDAVAEIGAWARWLKAQGARRLLLAGHSRGAAQAALYQLRTGDPDVAALLLLAPALAEPAETASAYEAAHGQALAPVVAKARALAPGEVLTAPFLYCREARVAAASFLDYYADEEEGGAPAILGRLGKTTLVVAAGADRLFPRLAAAAAPYVSERLALAVVDGADHFFQDLFAEDAVDAVADFVRTP